MAYTKLIALRVRRAQAVRLHALALRERTSASELVRGAIERMLDEAERQSGERLPRGATARAAG